MTNCEILDQSGIKERIVTILKRTLENKKEYAFNICSDKGLDKGIVAGAPEKGAGSSIRTIDECLRGKKIGAFHTHVKLTSQGDIIPSPGDIKTVIKSGMGFFCIGGIKEKNAIVRCFDRKDMLEQAHQKILSVGDVVDKMLVDKSYLDRHSCKRFYKVV